MTAPLPYDQAAGIAQPDAASPQAAHVTVLARATASRLIISATGVALLGIFCWLYLAASPQYIRILTILTTNPFPHPFIDWEWIPSAIDCWHRGIDVYIDNACYEPVLHGRHSYSPLWLRMTFLPYGKSWVAPFGLGLCLVFFAALTALPPPRRVAAFCITLLATFSSMTIFALERGNVDLLMFALAIAGVHCWFGDLRLRLFGYGIFAFAGLLKFYPFILLALALREQPRVFAGICLATLTILAAFDLTFHAELARASANLIHRLYYRDIFAATNLPDDLVAIAGAMTQKSAGDHTLPTGTTQSMLWSACLLTLIMTACLRAAELLRRFGSAFAALPSREAGFLVAGSLLTCACFFSGQSAGYRAIMILPTLPGLLWLGYASPDRECRITFMTTSAVVVFMMWKLTIWQIILQSGVGGLLLAHMLINELAWWYVVSVLLATILAFALNSTMGRWTARFIEIIAGKAITTGRGLCKPT